MAIADEFGAFIAPSKKKNISDEFGAFLDSQPKPTAWDNLMQSDTQVSLPELPKKKVAPTDSPIAKDFADFINRGNQNLDSDTTQPTLSAPHKKALDDMAIHERRASEKKAKDEKRTAQLAEIDKGFFAQLQSQLLDAPERSLQSTVSGLGSLGSLGLFGDNTAQAVKSFFDDAKVPYDYKQFNTANPEYAMLENILIDPTMIGSKVGLGEKIVQVGAKAKELGITLSDAKILEIAQQDSKIANAMSDNLEATRLAETPQAKPNVTNDIPTTPREQFANTLLEQFPPEQVDAHMAIIDQRAKTMGLTTDEMLTNQGVRAEVHATDGSEFAGQGLKQFAGENAKNADLDALAKAKTMTEQGVDKRQVWKDTGWMLDKDNKWKFEIDDSGASYKGTYDQEMKMRNGTTYSAGNMLDHPELYDNYPMKQSVRYEDTGAVNADGYMKAGDTYDHLGLNVKAMYEQGLDPKSTSLHEIQHAIQKREGFASGGNVESLQGEYEFLANDLRDLKKEREHINKGLDNVRKAGYEPSEEALNKYFEVDTKINNLIEKRQELRKLGDTAFEKYSKLHGEVEARNVQTRMNMTSEERRASHPHDTMDVPAEDTIVHFGDGTNMSTSAHSPSTILQRLKSDIDHNYLSIEEQNIHSVYHGELSTATIKLNDINGLIEFESGSKRLGGARKIIVKHGGEEKVGGLTPLELVKVGEVIRNGKIAENSFSETVDSIRYGYDLNKHGINYRVVVEESNDGKKVINYYSDRNFDNVGTRSYLNKEGEATRRSPSSDQSINPQSLNETEKLLQANKETANAMVQFGFKSTGEAETILRLFKTADVSSIPHEMAHIFRRGLSPQELTSAEKAFGVVDGKWTVANEEAFAEGFVKWLSEGKAPTPELNSVFKQFQSWLKDLWTTLIKTKEEGFKLTNEHRDFYRAMMGDPKAIKKLFHTKVMNARAQRIKALSEIPVGGSEDATKQAVKREFMKQPDSQYRGMTKAQIAELEHQQLMDEAEALFQPAPKGSRLEEWHKDSHPLTKNEDGTPKVFYHGNASDIESFNLDFVGNGADQHGSGFYFTNKADEASGYANGDKANIIPAYINIKNPIMIDNGTQLTKPLSKLQIKKLIENSPDEDAMWNWGDISTPRGKEQAIRDAVDGYYGMDALDTLNALSNDFYKGIEGKFLTNTRLFTKHDGVVVKFENGNQHVISFQPEQIKSIHNRGTFDETNPNILMQTATQTVKEDRNAVVQWAKDKAKTYLTFPKAYETATQAKHAGIAQDFNDAEIIHKALTTMSPKSNALLQQYIVKDITELPKEYAFLKRLGDEINLKINGLSDQLHDLGMLDEATRDAYKDKYLKRLYDEHWFGDKGQKEFVNSKGLPKEYLRGRQLVTDDAEQTYKYLNDYGVAKGLKPIIDGNIDEVMFDASQKGYFGDKSQGAVNVTYANGKYVFDRDYTKLEREAMGEIENAALTVPNTIARLSNEVQTAKMFKKLSEDNSIVWQGDILDEEIMRKQGFVQMPNSKRYGALSTKWVDARVAEDLVTMEKMGEDMKKWLAVLSVWKQSKTVWNAGAHVNNFSSNIMLRFLSGDNNPFGNMGKAHEMMKAHGRIQELKVKNMAGTATPEEVTELAHTLQANPYVTEATKIGLFGKSQLQDILHGFGGSDLFKQQQGGLGRKALNKVNDVAQGMYQAEDGLVRLAMYITRREKGMLPEVAQREIEAILPDYTRPLPQGIRRLRNSGVAPFISWSYYVLPNVLKLAKKNKWRAAAVIGAPVLLSEAVMQMQGQSNGNLPTDTVGRRLGYNVDSDGNIDTVKVDRILPAFDLVNIPLNAVMKSMAGYEESDGDFTHTAWEGAKGSIDASRNFVTSTLLSGPPIAAGYAMVSGNDSYTNRPIVGAKSKQTDLDEVLNVGRWINDKFLPMPLQAMSTYDFVMGQLQDQESRKKFQDTVPRTTGQGVAKLMGVNTMTYDPSATQKIMDKKKYSDDQ